MISGTARNIIAITVMIALLIIPGCGDSTAQGDDAELLDGQAPAPEFPSGMEWLNTDNPIKLSDLKGKLVLLDFWTFCCINCMHVIPDLTKLEHKYSQELVVIGVHSAKFTNERGAESIRQAILRYGIEHPVVNDKDFKIWNAYGARAWPTLVLINPNGQVVGSHSGEGAFDVFDPLIEKAVAYFDKKGELDRSEPDFALESEKAEESYLAFPGKIKADTDGNRLIITDSNNDRILIISEKGDIIEIIGSGERGSADGSFEEASFNRPQGTYLDGNTLYIADTENHLIRSANLETREVTTLLGTGEQARAYNEPGTGTEVALNSPWDVLVHNGTLYIAMAGSHQIWEADLKTFLFKPFAGSGREARIDGNRIDAALAQPSGLTSDGEKLYFTDSETSSIRWVELTPDGRVETVIGDDLFEFGDIDGPANVARLQHPLGIVWHDGVLYVADTYNSKVKVIDPVNKTSGTYAGTGEHGNRDGAFDEAQFFEPGGITFLNGRLYIADTNNDKIRVLDMKSKTVSTLDVSKGSETVESSASDEPEGEEEFLGRTVTLSSKEIGPGEGKLIVKAVIPPDFKFPEGAPQYLVCRSRDDSVIQPIVDEDAKAAYPMTIPVKTHSGETELIIEASLYICPKHSNICTADNVQLTIPVMVTEGASAILTIKIKAEVETPAAGGGLLY